MKTHRWLVTLSTPQHPQLKVQVHVRAFDRGEAIEVASDVIVAAFGNLPAALQWHVRHCAI